MPSSSASSRRAASSQRSPAATTPPAAMSHQPGRRPCRRIARCTSRRPSVACTRIDTERCLRFSVRIRERVTTSTMLPSGATCSTSSSPGRPGVGDGVLPDDGSTSTSYHADMTLDTLREEAREIHDDTVALRRRLHEHPSSATSCRSPARRCSSRSTACRSTSRCTRPPAGIAGLLTGGKPGPTVLLRGDMDALPAPRGHRRRLRVEVDGTHARLRARHPHGDAGRRARCWRRGATRSPGRVLFMFQPGEEGDHGARFMLDEGCSTCRRADGTRRRSPARSRSTSPRRCPPGGEHPGAGP
jgi:hypothetical protein